MSPFLLLVRHTGCMSSKPRYFPPNRAPKMLESQQLFFGLRLVSRMFEEYQQPAIKTTIVSCPQSSNHGLDTEFRNPKKIECRYKNRDQNFGFIFVLHKWLRTFKTFQTFKTEIKKLKVYSD